MEDRTFTLQTPGCHAAAKQLLKALRACRAELEPTALRALLRRVLRRTSKPRKITCTALARDDGFTTAVQLIADPFGRKGPGYHVICAVQIPGSSYAVSTCCRISASAQEVRQYLRQCIARPEGQSDICLCMQELKQSARGKMGEYPFA
ncbi:MAG: hypothetical protein ACI4O7_11360 [Aristaeellaceae bacterium]